MGKTWKEMDKKNVLKQKKRKRNRNESYEQKHICVAYIPNDRNRHK